MLGSEFSSCWLKVQRADEHAKTIRNEIAVWEKQNPYVLTKNHDAEGKFHSIHLQLTPVPDFDRWALIFGDFVNNLRSALDHLVYAVAVSQTKTNPPADERVLQFPIADTHENFVRQSYRIQHLSSAVRAIIERVQPYNRAHQTHSPLLGLLRDFDDCNKHRLLKVASCVQQRGEISIQRPAPLVIQSVTYLSAEIQNCGDVLSFTVEPPTLDVQYEYNARFMIGISHASGPTGIKRTTVRKVLDLLSEEVRTVVDAVGAKV